MSRLSKLIAELCPDGVEYRALGEVGAFTKGRGLQKKDFSETGVGCIHYGQIYTRLGIVAIEPLTYVSPEKAPGFTWVEPNDIVIAVTSENVDDVCKAVVWRGKDRIVTGAHAVVFHPFIDSMYVAYYLQTHCFNQQKIMIVDGVKVIEMKIDRLAKVCIPVPPIEVQREIVRILDSFQELDDALTAEIEARKVQFYEYCDAVFLNVADDYEPLNKVCSLIVDCPHSTAPDEGFGHPLIRTPNIGRGKLLLDGVQRVSEPVYRERVARAVPCKGDLVLAREGTAGNVAIIPDGVDVCLGQRTVLLRPNTEIVESSYLNFYLNATAQRERLLSKSAGSTVSHINLSDIRSFPVSIPTLAVQNDLLTKLTSQFSLLHTLSIEREARRKQFAYYRDKLLAFPELNEGVDK